LLHAAGEFLFSGVFLLLLLTLSLLVGWMARPADDSPLPVPALLLPATTRDDVLEEDTISPALAPFEVIFPDCQSTLLSTTCVPGIEKE
jgi:hypothetical protein